MSILIARLVMTLDGGKVVKLEIYVDGGCSPNPGGLAAWAFVVMKDKQEIDVRASDVGRGKGMSNNVAEYAAMRKALEWVYNVCRLTPIEKKVTIYSDSQLVVNQLNGSWSVKKGLYLSYYHDARTILESVRKIGIKVQLEYIPREKNIADKHVKRVLRGIR